MHNVLVYKPRQICRVAKTGSMAYWYSLHRNPVELWLKHCWENKRYTFSLSRISPCDHCHLHDYCDFTAGHQGGGEMHFRDAGMTFCADPPRWGQREALRHRNIQRCLSQWVWRQTKFEMYKEYFSAFVFNFLKNIII